MSALPPKADMFIVEIDVIAEGYGVNAVENSATNGARATIEVAPVAKAFIAAVQLSDDRAKRLQCLIAE